MHAGDPPLLKVPQSLGRASQEFFLVAAAQKSFVFFVRAESLGERGAFRGTEPARLQGAARCSRSDLSVQVNRRACIAVKAARQTAIRCEPLLCWGLKGLSPAVLRSPTHVVCLESVYL
ncbi:hypothetical protein TGRUB_254485 [Toxoplasma gondii RUB]|uniref:Uncharacterized protein n=1 Tax=Toxoplasma gondii RUB TaxID=935652 RepID=A0A086LTI7_TOXGO|nr:hypothetical protein TGRUB_254485 [Toxoplasma gondii RUB]